MAKPHRVVLACLIAISVVHSNALAHKPGFDQTDPARIPCTAGRSDDCDDGNPCTEDMCIDDFCEWFDLDGLSCDDGDPCTVADTCQGDQCVGVPYDCDDGNECTSDICQFIEGTHMCFYYERGGMACEDDDPCTENEHCVYVDFNYAYCSGPQIDCDDDNPCTEDCCEDGACVHTILAGESCNDGDSCTDGDVCLISGQCAGSAFMDCSDDDLCTLDECVDNQCQNPPVDCDDGNICTIELGCDPEMGCVRANKCDDTDPCTIDSCDTANGDCEFSPIWPPVDTCAPHGWTVTSNVPNLVLANNDDDNGNGVADYLDEGPVAGEDDLVWCPFSVSGGDVIPPCVLELSTYSWRAIPLGPLSLYLDSNMANPAAVNPMPSPAGVYISGHHNTSACGVPISFGAICGSEQHWCDAHSPPVVIAQVGRLNWRACPAIPGNPEVDYCPNNGGRRIFPGKISPNDNNASSRQQVDLVATVVPAVAGVPVYFKVWDVDDPFDQLNSGMANVSLIDNDAVGPDNRPSGEAPRTYTANSYLIYDELGRVTGAEAIYTLSVSMQPGNNYRAGASCLEDAIDQADQALADLRNLEPNCGGWSGYSTPLTWSPMLTVWRKLHVETDSMARPTFAENTIDTQWSAPRFPDGVLLLDIFDQSGNDDFENGFIRIKASGFPDLIARIITFENTLPPWDDVVHTSITESQWGERPTSGNHDCTISDDDLSDEDNFLAEVIGSDMGIGNPPLGHLPLPDTSELVSHYAPAYILPIILSEHTSCGAFPFVRNMEPELKGSWEPARLVLRGLPVSVPDFWTVYVLSAFQAERSEDYDGEDFATKGIATHEDGQTIGKWGRSYSGLTAIFLEGLRECCLEIQQRITIAHEVGHTLGLGHTPTGLMHETNQTAKFSAESLTELREYQGP